LKNYRQRLEELVRERTAELTRANEQLRAEIAERERAEADIARASEALRESEEKYRLLVETPAFVIMVVQDNKIVFANSATVQTFGAESVSEVIGSPPSRFITDRQQGRSADRSPRQQASEPNRPEHYETILRRADGTEFPAEVFSKPITYEGQPAIQLIAMDISQRQEAEEALRQQERLAAVGQLAGGIAHDFNNLLTTIMLYAQMPMSRPDLAPDMKRGLETIISESRQAAKLVQQILDFSRRSPIETHPVVLKPFIKEAVRVLQRTIPENISFVLELGAEEYVINADPTRIQQVLMNLVVNARDAMPNGGVLRIDLVGTAIRPGAEPPVAGMSPGEWICLSVSDTGTGIPPDALPHIFEPFFTTKPREHGTGLGLAQVYGIVAQHDGHIHVETEVGRGTAFEVYFPSHEAEEEQKAHEEVSLAAPPGKGETILLVEDDERIQAVAEQILHSLGYHVLTASNGKEALVLFRSAETIDLVVTDLVMPEMGGRELIQELQKEAPGLKAVATTGYALEEDRRRLIEQGIMNIVRKPFDMHELANVIRSVLDAD
jgi:two-component system cell cycle sensor histidine kinase/response regulator CckA